MTGQRSAESHERTKRLQMEEDLLKKQREADILTLQKTARNSKTGSSSSKHVKAKESPRKPMMETGSVDPNEFRRITRSQSKSPTKSTPKAARKTETDRDEVGVTSPTDMDAFADVIAMPNPAGEATSEVEISHTFDELNNFLNEEGMNNIELPMGRGPLPSMASATSSISSSSLTTLKTQGYRTVPIKDIGVNALKSTS